MPQTGETVVVLTHVQIDEIVAHAREHPDQEVCGVLGGRDDRIEAVYRARNVADTPRIRFEMDSRDIFSALKALDDQSLDLIGFYHSHTHTQAFPSPTDVAMWTATWGPDALCFICSLMEEDHPVLRAFRIAGNGQVSEERIAPEG